MTEKPIEVGRQTLRELLERGGYQFGNDDVEILQREVRAPDSLSPEDLDRLGQWQEAIIRGFFDAAADGYAAVPTYLIKERFGRSLKENYPDASSEFLKLATTFWTIKLIVAELRESNPYSVPYGILSTLEQDIVGPLFFPAYGPVKIDPKKRERDQRAFLNTYGDRIDVGNLMRGNPILLRDRAQGKGQGCLGSMSVIMVCSMVVTIVVVLFGRGL